MGNNEQSKLSKQRLYAKRKELGLCFCGGILAHGNKVCDVCLARQRTRSKQVRLDVIAAYGNQCAICQLRYPDILEVDHVNGDGNEHRKALRYGSNEGGSTAIYQDILKQGCPDTYQVLCPNCHVCKTKGVSNWKEFVG